LTINVKFFQKKISYFFNTSTKAYNFGQNVSIWAIGTKFGNPILKLVKKNETDFMDHVQSTFQEKGNLSIHTENIFPIIKKFLYSDNEIFLRELVSNAVDACQKIKTLASLNQYEGELGQLSVSVSFDKEKKTITISDTGIGMSADEIKKYINQIAFSGATEFVEKFKDQQEGKNQIIGHFGLGFYSAFMVASQVEIITKSYQNAPAARWVCDGSTTFEITEAAKESRGTEIILHVAEDSEEFLDQFKLKGILNKYCKFLPVEIKFEDEVINQTQPIWTKAPSDLKDEDYMAFYRSLYPMGAEPMFWIHLNVDYPFNLTGILYFPKIQNEFAPQREKIQLYSRQVFITDEVKDIVPEFLTMLHGVIDSPDIPLNVSRSFLQADSNVKKINNYITKKVAEKLQEIFRNDRQAFEEKWDSVGLFVKYGMITDEKFYERAEKFALLKNTTNNYFTFQEYAEKVGENQRDKNDNLVYLYTNDAQKQDTYIRSAQKRGYDVLCFDTVIDHSHFLSTLERKLEKTSLKRVDADVADRLIDKQEEQSSPLNEQENELLVEVFKKAVNNESFQIKTLVMPQDEMPVVVTIPEFMRRMKEMAATGGMAGMGNLPDMQDISVNVAHPMISKILASEDEQKRISIARHAYDLALLAQGLLQGPALTTFIERSLSMN